MNENGNKYALAALKDKRATLAGEIAELRKQMAWRQEQLGHVDATLRLFDPNADPTKLPGKRPYKHVKLFRQGELGRLILDALRRAGKPVPASDIVTAVLAETGNGESVRATMRQRVRGNLAYQERRGSVVKSGRGMGVKGPLPTR